MKIRILLVEDDQGRVEWFRAWLPRDIQLVHAGSGGKALGILLICIRLVVKLEIVDTTLSIMGYHASQIAVIRPNIIPINSHDRHDA